MLGLNPTVTANMEHSHPSLTENTANELSPVASRWVLFAAKQRHAMGFDAFQQPADTVLKPGRPCQPVVKDMTALVVEFLAPRLASNSVPKEQILRSLPRERVLQRFPVEMGGVTCVGTRTHIHDHINAVTSQKAEDRVQRVV